MYASLGQDVHRLIAIVCQCPPRECCLRSDEQLPVLPLLSLSPYWVLLRLFLLLQLLLPSWLRFVKPIPLYSSVVARHCV
jgi:hypothetical protein